MLRYLFRDVLQGVLAHSSAISGTYPHITIEGVDSDTTITVKFHDGDALTNRLADYASRNSTKVQDNRNKFREHRAKDNPGDRIDDFLGWYEPIKSPGAIGFNSDRILEFGLALCNFLECHYGARLDNAEMLLAICMAVLKTLTLQLHNSAMI